MPTQLYKEVSEQLVEPSVDVLMPENDLSDKTFSTADPVPDQSRETGGAAAVNESSVFLCREQER